MKIKTNILFTPGAVIGICRRGSACGDDTDPAGNRDPVFIRARKQQHDGKTTVQGREIACLIILPVLSITAIALIRMGDVTS